MPDRIFSQLQWTEVPLQPFAVLEVARARPDSYPQPVLQGSVWVNPLPLEDWAKVIMPAWVNVFTDIKVLSDKPCQLKDGTPAREVEFEFVPKYDVLQRSMKDPPKHNGLLLATKKDLTWIVIILTDDRGKIGEDLRRIAYSLTFLQGREEPVNVPPDVRAFLDMWCTDVVGHDVKTIMAHYSDRFRFTSLGKAFFEQMYRDYPSPFISCEPTVTVFEPRGDRAYVDGFFLQKVKGDANALKMPMGFQQIINEHGEWKWYGNQK